MGYYCILTAIHELDEIKKEARNRYIENSNAAASMNNNGKCNTGDISGIAFSCGFLIIVYFNNLI